MKRKDLDLHDLQYELFRASCKLRGIAELLFSCDRDAIPLDEGEVWSGIGMILRELGEELRSRSRDIDEHQVIAAQRRRQQAEPKRTFEARGSAVHDRGQHAQKRSRK